MPGPSVSALHVCACGDVPIILELRQRRDELGWRERPLQDDAIRHVFGRCNATKCTHTKSSRGTLDPRLTRRRFHVAKADPFIVAGFGCAMCKIVLCPWTGIRRSR